jgi:hypothetical protein
VQYVKPHQKTTFAPSQSRAAANKQGAAHKRRAAANKPHKQGAAHKPPRSGNKPNKPFIQQNESYRAFHKSQR